MYKVENDQLFHMDFVTARDADKLVYDEILSGMKKIK